MDSIVEDRIKTMLPLLDEKQKRIYLAAEAEGLGYGGLKAIHELTGVSKTTIIKGKKEIQEGTIDYKRIRRSGGGRKAIEQKYGSIKEELEKIVGDNTLGNPEKIILWTTKSLRNIENIMREKGFNVSHDTIGNLLKEMGYSLQQNQKMVQTGEPHPDRNAQFEHINKKCGEFMQQGQPVISGGYEEKGNGREFQKQRSGI